MEKEHTCTYNSPSPRTPWNKGKLIGAKPPLRPSHVWFIRTKLQIEGRRRDLALFNLAIDSKLRGCDVVAVRVDDVAPSGYAMDRATVRQKKSQIQALDRTQPGLPLKKGRAATMTHDYKRHGVTTLYAAMDVKSGLVIGDCQPRHRAREFIAFLRRIERVVKTHLNVHVVLDNSSTHKTDEVKAWLTKHPRFKLHFTPTSASWLNLVERFFAEITRKRIRRGVFTSVAQLEEAIHDYLLHHNADPKPFVWTKTAETILKKERRALDRLDVIRAGNQATESEH